MNSHRAISKADFRKRTGDGLRSRSSTKPSCAMPAISSPQRFRPSLDRRDGGTLGGGQGQRLSPIRIEGGALRECRHRRLQAAAKGNPQRAERKRLDPRSDRDGGAPYADVLLDPPPIFRAAPRSIRTAAGAGTKLSEATCGTRENNRGILLDGIEGGSLREGLDTRIVAESLLGMLRGINRYCREYTTPESATDAVVAIFLDGCATRPRIASTPWQPEFNSRSKDEECSSRARAFFVII